MASFRKRGSGWEYRIKYTDPVTGKRKEKSKSGFKTKKEAQIAAAEVEKKLFIGEFSIIESKNITVKDWLEKWINVYSNHWSESTKQTRNLYVHSKLIPRFGHLKLSQLSRVDYQKFINDLSEEYTRKTVQTIHSIFCTAINKAIELEILTHNKFQNIQIKKDEEEINNNYLTKEELSIFLNAAKQSKFHHYVIVMTLLRTGMRKGELLALTWEDIDLDKKQISITKTRSDRGVKSPKTKLSNRTISIDSVLVETLQKYKTWQKKNKLRYGASYQDSKYVFTKYRGGKLGEYAINKIIDGILEKTNLHHITPHGLRHTHAIMLLESGVDIKTVSDRLGHASIDMTANVYLHVTKKHEEASVLKFESYLSNL